MAMTDEAALYIPDTFAQNWGALMNANLTQLDAGLHLTLTAGVAIAQYDIVWIAADGDIEKADANASKIPPIGIAPIAIANGNDGLVQINGWIDIEDAALTCNEMDIVYVSDTAGKLTITKPVNGYVFGYAKTATAANITRIIINPQYQERIDGRELTDFSATYGGVPFILKADLTAGSTVAIFNANAPFKFRVLDAWSVATSADGGTWLVDDGANAITDTVTVTGTDKTIDRAGTIDNAEHEIAAGGSLRVVGDGANADVIVYVMCMRVA